MRALKKILREILGLFVDDGSFALWIVVWLLVVWQVLPRIAVPRTLQGLILVAGLAALLIGSVWRHARQEPGRKR